MKILPIAQMREADLFTIQQESITPLDLMERASVMFVHEFIKHYSDKNRLIQVFCGLGDNGGDGLAIARLLHELNYRIEVYILVYSSKKSESFLENLDRLSEILPLNFISSNEHFPVINAENIVVDAIFGSGLSRKLDGIVAEFVSYLNQSQSRVVAVDIPSGLWADESNDASDCIVKASRTFTFELPKLTFFMPQSASFVGEWKVITIGLSKSFIHAAPSIYYWTEEVQMSRLVRPREKFSHKGTYGHALLVAGSDLMMGAAFLSAKACLRSGVGKLTIHSVASGKLMCQITIPEAIFWQESDEGFIGTDFSKFDFWDNFQAFGVGPGLGTHAQSLQSLLSLLELASKKSIPMVIDADALNLLSENEENLHKIPSSSILTPHPKEFKRLLGRNWTNDFEKIALLRQFSQKFNLIVCLKGAYTAIAFPNGEVHFNSNGNPGMAKAGSGDVLTGMILAFLAQGYSPQDAARLGVFWHGKAGDNAVEKRGIHHILASDIIENIRF